MRMKRQVREHNAGLPSIQMLLIRVCVRLCVCGWKLNTELGRENPKGSAELKPTMMFVFCTNYNHLVLVCLAILKHHMKRISKVGASGLHVLKILTVALMPDFTSSSSGSFCSLIPLSLWVLACLSTLIILLM